MSATIEVLKAMAGDPLSVLSRMALRMGEERFAAEHEQAKQVEAALFAVFDIPVEATMKRGRAFHAALRLATTDTVRDTAVNAVAASLAFADILTKAQIRDMTMAHRMATMTDKELAEAVDQLSPPRRRTVGLWRIYLRALSS